MKTPPLPPPAIIICINWILYLCIIVASHKITYSTIVNLFLENNTQIDALTYMYTYMARLWSRGHLGTREL